MVSEGESLADAVTRIDRLDPNERMTRATRAREAAVAFAERNTEQWIEILAPCRNTMP